MGSRGKENPPEGGGDQPVSRRPPALFVFHRHRNQTTLADIAAYWQSDSIERQFSGCRWRKMRRERREMQSEFVF